MKVIQTPRTEGAVDISLTLEEASVLKYQLDRLLADSGCRSCYRDLNMLCNLLSPV